jgi:predicted permease
LSGTDSRVFTTVASGTYFLALGIPLRTGRLFDERDRAEALPVALIGEELARRFFPDGDPIGRRIVVGVMGPPVEREIVGVVGDVRKYGFDSAPRPEVFVPFEQSTNGSVTFVVKAARGVDAAALMPQLRERLWSVDPGQSVYHSATVESLLAATLAERRFQLGLLGGLAALALALAAVGVYSLISFSVRRRMPELGVRLALGARPSQVVKLVVREGAGLTISGVAIGLAAAWATTRLMRGMLYGVKPYDTATFVQLGILVVVVGAVASAIPAIRAVARDPVRALRDE